MDFEVGFISAAADSGSTPDLATKVSDEAFFYANKRLRVL
jgi:hypothetical protein